MGQCYSKQSFKAHRHELTHRRSPILGLKPVLKKTDSNTFYMSDASLYTGKDSMMSSQVSLQGRGQVDGQLKKKVSFDLMAELATVLPSLEDSEVIDMPTHQNDTPLGLRGSQASSIDTLDGSWEEGAPQLVVVHTRPKVM